MLNFYTVKFYATTKLKWLHHEKYKWKNRKAKVSLETFSISEDLASCNGYPKAYTHMMLLKHI
jgi:hypothetical protein